MRHQWIELNDYFSDTFQSQTQNILISFVIFQIFVFKQNLLRIRSYLKCIKAKINKIIKKLKNDCPINLLHMISKPNIHENAFVHPSATIIGDVTIGTQCSVFPKAVIRGDENHIVIGEGTNIQDCCVIHVNADHPTTIGDNVSLGHCAMVHGATIEKECIIGIHATILNGAVIKKGSIIGANALVTQESIIPENSLVLGIPGKIVKQDKNFRNQAQKNAEIYKQLAKEYLEKKFPEHK